MSDKPRIVDAEAHYRQRLRAFARESVAPGGIVLLGSSHFEWFPAQRLLPHHRFVNRAIASDRLGIGDRGILHRLDISVFALHPDMVVFNNGVNDLGELHRTGQPAMDAIRDAYARVVDTIRSREPNASLLIVNELPTTGRFAALNPLIGVLNAHIARVAHRAGCALLDFHRVVVVPPGRARAGELRAELTWDGLHLNDRGYALLARHLEPLLPPAPQ